MEYISLLWWLHGGINVSGKKKIKMLDLILLYESLGFNNIATYIQSWNVIFDTQHENISEIKSLIEQVIKSKYHFHVPVEIRTKKEITNIIKNNPFAAVDLEKNGTRVLVTFLSIKPDKNNSSNLLSYVNPPEKLIIKDKTVCFHCPNGYGKSKLTNNFIENKLKLEATTRNWKSLLKLDELSEA